MKYTTHFGWVTLMLLLFLLNYMICWYVWVTTDKRKAFTWAAPLLCLYPQYGRFGLTQREASRRERTWKETWSRWKCSSRLFQLH